MLKLILHVFVLAAFLWRIAAFWYPHPAVSDPAMVSRWLAGMGLWFLLCTLWAYVYRPNRSTGLLLIYGVLSAIHWGGPISIGQEHEHILAVFYLVISSIGAQCVFLNLAVLGSTARRPGHLCSTLIYAPLIAGIFLLAFHGALPEQRQVFSYITTLVSVATVFGVIGAGFWVYGWIRSEKKSDTRFRKGIVAGSLVGWIPPALAMSGVAAWSGLEGLLNLTLSLEPAALAWFFTRDTSALRLANG